MASEVGSWLGRFLRALALVGVLWFGLLACGVVIDSDERDHVLGRSTEVTVDVLASTPESDCGRRKEEHVVTYRVVGEDDARTTRMCRKSALEAGRRQAWLTEDEIHLSSPATTVAWGVTVPFAVAALVATFGRVSSRSRRH